MESMPCLLTDDRLPFPRSSFCRYVGTWLEDIPKTGEYTDLGTEDTLPTLMMQQTPVVS